VNDTPYSKQAIEQLKKLLSNLKDPTAAASLKTMGDLASAAVKKLLGLWSGTRHVLPRLYGVLHWTVFLRISRRRLYRVFVRLRVCDRRLFWLSRLRLGNGNWFFRHGDRSPLRLLSSGIPTASSELHGACYSTCMQVLNVGCLVCASGGNALIGFPSRELASTKHIQHAENAVS